MFSGNAPPYTYTAFAQLITLLMTTVFEKSTETIRVQEKQFSKYWAEIFMVKLLYFRRKTQTQQVGGTLNIQTNKQNTWWALL